MVWMKSGECVNFQRLASALESLEMAALAGNCANFAYPDFCDSKKPDFFRSSEIKDIARPCAITFFGEKRCSRDKKSSRG
jgi:hypothetical protein